MLLGGCVSWGCDNIYEGLESSERYGFDFCLLILSSPVSSSSNFFLTLSVGLSASLNVRIVYLDIMRPFAESTLLG
jgi:hypothetical protein